MNFDALRVNIGSIVGAAITNATKSRLDKASYQIPIGTLFIVPVFLAIGLFFVPESPRWLLNKGRTEKARKALETLRGDSVALEYIELEWTEMVKGIEEEKRLATTVGVLDMFKSEPADPPLRAQELIRVDTDLRRTLLCYGMIACQTASGIVDEAFKFSVMNTCIGFIGVNCGMFAMRHLVGRRSILMGGAAFCGLCMLALAIAASVATSPVVLRNCLIAFTALFFFGYNSCVGAASYPVATELVSTRLRSWTVGTATSLGYFLAWLTAFCTPYFINPENMNWVSSGSVWLVRGPMVLTSFSRELNTVTSGRPRTSSASDSSSFACQSLRAAVLRKLTSFSSTRSLSEISPSIRLRLGMKQQEK